MRLNFSGQQAEKMEKKKCVMVLEREGQARKRLQDHKPAAPPCPACTDASSCENT